MRTKSEMSKTSKAPNEHEPRTRKRRIEEERSRDVPLPLRSQLHVTPEEVVLAATHALDDDYHTEHTCWRCAMEMDPDYGVDEDGMCYHVGPNPPFVPR